MRFVELEVTAFQAIAAAKLQFAPQLNVLYGPNDLGKSTLITALRAALLTPPTSAAGRNFRSWFQDRNPRVALTLEQNGSYWRVTKEFEEGKGAAELAHSKDGRHFTIDEKGRKVEEVVRRMLAWGIAEAGPRGSDSFLVNALLAGQTEVDTLFTRSVDADGSDSGKRALAKALAALAQDPLFKRVLDTAQQELKTYFGEKGMKKRGAKSPFTIVGNEVKQLRAELDQARLALDQSAGTERAVEALLVAAREARAQEREATSLVETARTGLERGKERSAAEARLNAAKGAWTRAEELLASTKALQSEVAAAETSVASLEAGQRQARTDVETARSEVARAEAALQRANSQAGASLKAVELETAKRRLAELSERVGKGEARKERAVLAVKIGTERAEVDRSLTKARDDLSHLERSLLEAQQAEGLATSLLDYGRWREAVAVADRFQQAKTDIVRLEAEIATRTKATEAQRAELARLTATLHALESQLPPSAQVSAFLELENEKKLAEAQMGGGVTVTIRPRDELRLHVELDDEQAADEVLKANKEKLLEAERKVSLAIGQMVELEVVTGSKQGRQHRDALVKRWRLEVIPVLTTADVSSLAELQRKVAGVESERAKVAQLQAAVDRSTIEARGVEQQLTALKQQRPGETADTLQRRKDRIPPAQFQAIAEHFVALGETWERDAESLLSKHRAEVGQLNERTSKARAAIAGLEARAAGLTLPSDAEPLQLVTAELDRALAERTGIAATIANLEGDQGTAAKEVQRLVAVASARLAEAESRSSKGNVELERASQGLHEAKGRLKELEKQAAGVDRTSLKSALDGAQRAFEAFAGIPNLTPESLVEAESLLARLRADADAKDAEFHKAEGALSKVGGSLARERVEQLEEALAAALAKEAELELEARAWQLLHATLREAEDTESGHLGRALAEPVTAQLQDLTEGRYGGVELGPHLTTAGVTAAGTSISGDEVLKALSVGTRDQLASLLRIAIARQLGSALILDDHLVHTDPGRMSWFVDALRRASLDAQVIVVTCRPQDYVPADSLRGGEPVRDLAGGSLRLIDLERTIEGWPQRSAG